MGFNFKEWFANLDKKNLVILVCTVVLVALVAALGLNFDNTKSSKTAVPVEQSTGEPALKKPSEYNIGIDYKKAIKGNKPIIALFYADWCRYCIAFMPVYERLSKKYKNVYEFAKVDVEDPKYAKIVKDMDISGFPTVFLLDPKYDNKVLLSNSYLHNDRKLDAELDRFARIRSLLDKKN